MKILSSASWLIDKLIDKIGQGFVRSRYKANPSLFYTNETEVLAQGTLVHQSNTSNIKVANNAVAYPSLSICYFSNCQIVTPDKIPVINGKLALPLMATSNYRNSLIHLHASSLINMPGAGKQLEKKKGNYLLMKNRWSQNYHHWICEFLPALAYVKQFVPDIIPVVDTKLNSFQQATLSLLGFQTSNLEYDSNFEAEKLYTVFNIRTRQNDWPYSLIAPGALQALRDQMLAGATTQFSSSSPIDVLWISRKDENNRHVINEEDFFNACPFAVEVLYPGRSTVAKQIELSSRASIIVGPHGAGLSNLVWSKHATLIEIAPTNGINNSFVGLAASLGCSYHLFQAESTGFHLMDQRKNLQIKIPGVIQLLQAILQKD